MKFRSQVYTAVSGSVGGLTYSHNSGGMYTRGRATPTNPNSAGQQAVRMNMASLATSWRALTQAARDNWKAWAMANPITDAFGDPLILTGQQMYNRLNSPRMRAGLAVVSAAPSGMGEADLTPCTISYATATASVAYDNSDLWANVAGGGLIIQTGIMVGTSINFYASPYRFLQTVIGDPTPPTSPSDFTSNAFGQVLVSFLTTGRQFVRVRASNADGRLSPVQTLQVDIA